MSDAVRLAVTVALCVRDCVPLGVGVEAAERDCVSVGVSELDADGETDEIEILRMALLN